MTGFPRRVGGRPAFHQASVLAIGLSLVFAAAAAHAETASPAAGETATQGLDEIVVTAQKREERLQDVPVSVVAVSSAKINELHAISLGSLAAFTPGLVVDDSSVTQPRFTIRGVATDDFGIGTEPAVAVFVDGIYTARTGSALIFFNDIERVEVLKGPQGTIFGRNTSAGAISIVTKKPEDRFTTTANFDFGNYGSKRIEAMINVPLTHNLQVRGDVLINRRDGWLHDAVTGKGRGFIHTTSGRISARWTPDSATDIVFAWDHDETRNDGPVAIGISQAALSRDPFGPFTNDVVGGARETRLLNGYALTINRDITDGLKLTSISSYRRFSTSNREDEDGTNDPTRYLDTDNIESNKSFYQELRLSHDGEKLHWLLGGSYFNEVGHQTSAVTALVDSIDFALSSGGLPLFSAFAGAGLPVFGNTWREDMTNTARNKSFAAFGDVTWNVTDKWSLRFGLRYTNDRKTFTWFAPSVQSPGLSAIQLPGAVFNAGFDQLGLPPLFDPATTYSVLQVYQTLAAQPFLAGAPIYPTGNLIFNEGALQNVPFTRKASFNDVSPRFVVSYKFTPDVMAYVSASRGYKAGGFNSQAINSYFRPETVWNFEAGVKSEFFDRRLRFNLTGYYFRYNDRQSISLVQNGSTIPQYVTTTGSSKAYGVDLDTALKINDYLSLTGTLSWIDSTWASRIEQVQTFSGPINLNLNGQPTGEPRLSSTFGVHATAPVSFGKLFADFNWSHRSRARTNARTPYDDALDTVLGGVDWTKLGTLRSSRDLVNARIGGKSANERVTVAFWVENLFNKQYMNGINNITTTTFGTPYTRISPPRFFGGSVTLKY